MWAILNKNSNEINIYLTLWKHEQNNVEIK
jgi:hypothetical protein